MGGTPFPGGREGTPSQAGGRGYPLPRWGEGVPPSQVGGGGTHSQVGRGVPLPRQGGGYPFPGRGRGYLLPRWGEGYPFPGRRSGYPLLEQHSVYLLRGGRYASCVHAGGLSCLSAVFLNIFRNSKSINRCGANFYIEALTVKGWEMYVYLVYGRKSVFSDPVNNAFTLTENETETDV